MTPATVHVWGFDLDVEPGPFVPLLDEAESARASRFHFPEHRDRFIVGRGLLKLILSNVAGVPAPEIRFEYGRYGKPMLRHRAGPHFNTSHSDGRALVAVCEAHPVGIDIERIRPLSDLNGVAAVVFNERERRQLDAWDGEERQQAFFRGWSRKEAYFKATGVGLSATLHALTVDLASSMRPIVEIHGDDARRWSMQDVLTVTGYSGAVAVPCARAGLVCHGLAAAAPCT
jgi:4'-phosphopantetheinyl transferase